MKGNWCVRFKSAGSQDGRKAEKHLITHKSWELENLGSLGSGQEVDWKWSRKQGAVRATKLLSTPSKILKVYFLETLKPGALGELGGGAQYKIEN